MSVEPKKSQQEVEVDEVGVKVNGIRNDVRKIRYASNEIKVEKRPGKRTASALCAFGMSKQKPVRGLQRSESLQSTSASMPSSSPPSSVLQLSCDSDHSDTLSCISDLSDLSMLSDTRLDKHKVPVAGVHGASNVRIQLRQLSNELTIVKSENAEYQKQALFVTSHKEELFKLKSKNFSLQRENANLLSQLKSAQELCESLRESIQQIQTRRNDQQPVTPPLDLHLHCSGECKGKLRSAHDEIFRLKTEITQRKLEVRNKDEEVCRLRNRLINVETSSHDLTNSLEIALKSREASENALKIFHSERESFIKSRDWYRDQLHSAQESRNGLQQDLVDLQKVEVELARTKILLEEERLKFLKDKEDFRHQLDQLVVLERDRLVQTSSTPDGEKLRLCEEDIQSMKGIVEDLKSELSYSTEKLQEKTKLIENLQHQIITLEDDKLTQESIAHRLQSDLKESQLNLELLGQQLSEAKIKISKDKDLISSFDSDLRQSLVDLQRVTDERDANGDLSRRLSDELVVIRDSLQVEIVARAKVAEDLRIQKVEFDHILEERKKILLENESLVERLSGLQLELREALENGQKKDKELRDELESMKTKYFESKVQYESDLEALRSTQKEICLSNDDCESTEDQVARLESFLEDSLNKIDVLESKNERISRQLEEARSEIDRHNNAEEDHPEDLVNLQARKIVRLECSVAIFEAEVAHLSSAMNELEEQVLRLEKENGKLLVESQQSEALKSQIKQLQEDIRTDTELRKELLVAIERARLGLYSEVSNLESTLRLERESHAETKAKLLFLEHLIEAEKDSTLQQPSTVQSEVSRVTKSQPDDKNDSSARLNAKILDLEKSLKDQESGFLKASERCLKQEKELQETRQYCKELRTEILELTKKTDDLSEEKNSYRSQVQDMNTALRNSLEHIRRLKLRGKFASTSPSPQALSPLPHTSPTSPTHSLDESLLVGLLSPKSSVSNNLSKLQNCLAALKTEMVVLQSKLEPSSPSKKERIMKN